MRIDMDATELRVLSGLKDFQRATVDRVIELFKEGQNRVLVADEVGLGKTLIARGVIARTAKYHQEEGDDLFKVIYICSNQSIASQNIKKLKINEKVTIDGVSDTRLSMQHLKIFEQEYDQEIKNNFVQIIPLTPGTSFSMTSGTGIKEERALMFAILRRVESFQKYEDEMDKIFASYATSGWQWTKNEYDRRVEECDNLSGGKYIEQISKTVMDFMISDHLIELLLEQCQSVRNKRDWHCSHANSLIGSLRMVFAKVSIDLLKPDLVIMDEFQRFRSLIAAETDTETGMLAERFLKNEITKVLLLSATPFKLYSTLEEMNVSEGDDHYYEFFQVMDFLFSDSQKRSDFREIWKNYSIKLREANFERCTIIEMKNRAEEAMFNGVCRTERNSVKGSDDVIDASSITVPLKVTTKDILSYLEADQVIREVAEIGSVPVDYIKSAPYIFSFMKEYKLKKRLHKFFTDNPENIREANKKHLWINEQSIKKYTPLEVTNARLERLNETVFKDNAHMLLWIPPSAPYYMPQGVFANAGNYSKTLVFSAWEMVPRMIATLLSYESERVTVGNLIKKNQDEQKANYSTRYPLARLKFSVVNEEPQSMAMFCLLYPSKGLTDIYDPLSSFGEKTTLESVETSLKSKLEIVLERLKEIENDHGPEDQKWYFLAPLLMDPPGYASRWLNHFSEEMAIKITDSDDKGQKGIMTHVAKLRDYFYKYQNGSLKLGKMPADLINVLIDQAIASPAVCAARTFQGSAVCATLFSKAIFNLLNRPESIAIIDLCIGSATDEAYWRNVLTYCKHGNFQSMLDEYTHVLSESNGLADASNRTEALLSLMLDSMQAHSASYVVDTFSSFKNSILDKKERGLAIRSHFAVAFQNSKSDQKQDIRKENIRNAFNSPFRPFVLATTSIGQEGLDFHLYCRKIMHWNLPSNPIDLEQREGRINRFKCHAIRLNLANAYASKICVKKDVWHELFDYAKHQSCSKQSDLVPFWCLPNVEKDDHEMIKIERIVPQYPMSRDVNQYNRLIKILSLYRLSLGQPRQEELLEQLLNICSEENELNDFFINLSPFFRGGE